MFPKKTLKLRGISDVIFTASEIYNTKNMIPLLLLPCCTMSCAISGRIRNLLVKHTTEEKLEKTIVIVLKRTNKMLQNELRKLQRDLI